MHFIQRKSPVIFNIVGSVRCTASVAFPWGAMKFPAEDIRFWPWFTFMVLGVDTDIQKVVNLLVRYRQGGSDHAEKR